MIICFNATAEAKKALDELMATAQFKDVSQVICMALENYQVLQLTTPPGGGVMALPLARQNENQKGEVAVVPAARENIPSNYPPLFTLRNTSIGEIKLATISKPAVMSANLPPAQWLFGQYNKFLPVKATCRALYNLLQESPSGVSIEDATSEIADAACGLGDYLKTLDIKHNFRREDALASAFPSSDIKGGGSRLRFGNQFVANIKQKRLEGFPAALHLMAVIESKDSRLSLTKAGAAFAALANPVLDGNVSVQKLGDKEIEFMLDHISRFVPEESSAYVAVMDAIDDDANTPDKMDIFLRDRFGLQEESSITATFLSTQRTGAISRLADLGLIGRKREGLHVSYFVTKTGKTFRSKISEDKK